MPRSHSRSHSRQRNRSRKYREKTPQNMKKRKESSRERHQRKSNNYKHDRQSSYSSSSSSYSYSSISMSFSSSSKSGSISCSTQKRRKIPHFKYSVGEKIGHKYRVTRLLGTGTFGRVVEGRYEGKLYAIKVIKPVQKYIDSAKTERGIIKELCERDSRDQHHLVRYTESLYHYNHFCLVFESLGPSLYDIIKKNRFVGFPPQYVQSYAKQLFQAVGFMHRCGYTHTDLKLENILICGNEFFDVHLSQQKKVKFPKNYGIKLIDFGGATHKSESHSDIINTRQYRCPQVVLQCKDWNELSDVWSIGCILVELATGNLLFPIHHEVDHIYLIDKLIGRFPRWMAENCDEDFKKYLYQDGALNYRIAEKDLQDPEAVKSTEPLQIQLKGYEGLEDFVRSCLTIDPKKRMSCQDALKHSYFSLDLKQQQPNLPLYQEPVK